jgi:hypothetical protein
LEGFESTFQIWHLGAESFFPPKSFGKLIEVNYNKVRKCPKLQMYLAFHPSTNVNRHLTKNQITTIVEGLTYDDATSPKGRMTFDDITNLVDLSTESQLGKLSM